MFHMGWFLTTGFGVYGWNQPWSGNVRSDVGRPDLFVDTATSLERAGFDYLMFEDSSVLPDVFRGSFESSVRGGQAVRFDPMPLMPLVAQATSRIGIVATAATTFYPPFLAARLYQTLDHLTDGRIGINLVTASPHAAAQNYGLEKHVEHDLRYEMADEWMQAVDALWGSWETGALQMDESTGVFADHTKIHHVDFEGGFYRTRGPLNTPPGPQGRPVICQAGGSPAGRNLGATHADTIISAVVGVDAMKAYRDDISERLLAVGRKPSDVKVLFLVAPILADTDAEAQEKRDRMRAAQAANIDGNLAAMSYFTSMDFSKFDLDAPLPDLSENNGHQSTMADFARSGKTLREIAANHRTIESIELCGTTETVAGQMAEAMEHAGGDGFLIASPVTRKNVAEIADGLAPVLRRKGLIRSGYDYAHFRDNLLAF
ncbi:NtaA/DmoA family FMN-dependent monooxygenase [Cellulomonas dongxiuzhuiae]|uniref:NtaA/DmoA family FMN-dependent monooxygenase n=1 Tax=Cellulomonas dongxiuzhuiae TaxID=2819979 RepID=A0ABX8GJ66_9CELL|nr:NtaA/DmoA family FMN-dependent monooxygenase [Cellulomonas dongxiuzhuiae]MBO3095241.1 NtaA/DmoA family FMN-dependent monooxygenase [Cellulomonas dongxiuzhuiae]QWC16238.1 NtaA/DmoA family FMN-dependent monooxygenase [Cellulomonas dongxiuzhuiae]